MGNDAYENSKPFKAALKSPSSSKSMTIWEFLIFNLIYQLSVSIAVKQFVIGVTQF